MSIRMRKAYQRRPRHLEVLQHSVVHQRHALRRHALIIELVVPQQIFPAQLLHRRVVHNAQETRQDFFSNFFRKRLSLSHIFLPVPLGTVPKNFVEKDRGRAPGQKRRAHGRIVDGCFNQPFQFLAHGRFRGIHGFVVRRLLRIHPVKVVIPVDVHPVRRFALDEQLEPVANLPVLQLRALAAHLQNVLRLRAEGDNGIDNRRRFPKRFGVRPHFRFPRRAIHADGNLRSDVNARLLAGKVRRVALGRFHFHFFPGPDFDQRLFCSAVLFVRFKPNGPAQHFGVVIQGHGHAGAAALHLPLTHFVRIVQVITSRADRDFQPAVARFTAVQ